MTRRELMTLLGGGALACAAPACVPRPATGGDRRALEEPIYYSSVAALASAIRDKVLSSQEIVRSCLARIEEVNPRLNAVVQIAGEEALARAREADAALARGETWGVLHGVPMTIKDSLDTAGVISTGGTKGRAAFVPERDATVVRRLREAGAILMGKTNTPELTLSFETDNLVYGRTNNPFDVTRTSGGSSGGAAAIVAVGGSPFDIGSDFGGSIRLPAHFCGITGLKPSAGRVPRTGHIYPFGGVQDSMQQIGPLARYVDDLTLLMPVIAGPDRIDPGVVPLPWRDPNAVVVGSLRVSFHTDNGVRTPTDEIARAVRAAASAIGAEGASVEEVRPSGIGEVMELVPLFFWDGGAAVMRLLREAGTTEHTLQGFTGAVPLTAVELDRLIGRWYGFRSGMHSFLKDFDAIVCPVNALPAGSHGSSGAPDALTAYSYTFTYNLTGWPGAVVRAGTSPEGLPIGVQVVAGPGREDVVLAVAKVLETTLGGFERPRM